MISLRQTISFIVVMIALIAIAQAAQAAKLVKVSTTAKSTANTVGKASERGTSDRALMRAARIAFEKKDYQKALSLYEQVPQSSDYWTEALEERAWSHVHLKEHDQALANLKTLFAPPVKSEIGGEPYLLSALVQLRLCNYNELFKGLKRFKDDIRPRFEAMEALSKTGESEASVHMLGRAAEAGALSRAAAGADLPNLPRLFYRDAQMQAAFNASLKPGASDRHSRIVTMRMKALATRDVKETQAILRKLHLVEVEAVSRMYTDVHLADAKKTSPAIERNANTLVFPDDNNDVWLDEIDSYRVNAKGCPASAQTKGPQS